MRKDVYTRHIKNEKKHWWFSARREIIYSVISNLKQKESITILDFGAGSGANIEILTKLGKVDVYERLFEDLQVNIAHTKEVLGWKPRISMDESLKKMMQEIN